MTSLQPNFNIENLNITDLQTVEIKTASYFNSGRLFKLYLNGTKSINYTLDEVVKRVQEIALKNINPREIKSLRTFISKLKDVDSLSNLSAESQNLNHLIIQIQQKALNLHSIIDSEKTFKRPRKAQVSLIHHDTLEKKMLKADSAALILGISTGNMEIVNRLIHDKNIDVNKADEQGSIPLLTAILFGRVEMVKLLLRHEMINVNLHDEYGSTPLIFTAISGKTGIMKLLLGHKKIDVNLQDKQGFTALFSAIYNRDTPILKLLLKHSKIDVNIQNEQGNSPLHLAITNDMTEFAKLLIKYKSTDVNLQNKQSTSPLMLAINQNMTELTKLLLLRDDIDVNQLDSDSRTAFLRAKTGTKNDIIKVIKTHLKPRDLFIQKEMLKLITLAHSAHLKGNIQIQFLSEGFASNPIKLEGLTDFYAYKKLSKATKSFSQNHPMLINKNETTHLQDLIDSGLINSNEHTLTRLAKGLPVLFSAGYLQHSVSILVWGPYFILCNRGRESRKVVEVYRYKGQLDSEILDKIKNVSEEPSYSYRKLFFDELPNTLEFIPQEGFEKSFEDHCNTAIGLQTVGNCTWASPEAGVFAFLTLFNLLSDDNGQLDEKIVPDSIHHQASIIIKKKFTTWLGYMQTYSLENYLGVHYLRSSDSNEKIEKSAQRRKSIAIDYPVTIAATKAIKNTAKKHHKPDELLLPLQHILAKTICIITNVSVEKNLETAKEILDSIENTSSDELKKKIEQSS